MSLDTPIGSVTLGGTVFSTDPYDYQDHEWAKRASVHKCLGGVTIIQDFGHTQGDLEILLSSGTSQFLTKTAVDALSGLFRARGATYTLSDWLGNSFTVSILDFRPRQQPRTPGLFTYTMRLQVVQIAMFHGTPYTGP